jgi:ribosomal protein S18 acetylase RimI-like enzyme
MSQEKAELLLGEISPSQIPLDLLLLADPFEKRIRRYLPVSRCFAARLDGKVVGACVVMPLARNEYELMSIAVEPSRQQKGIGTRLLKFAITAIGRSGAERLEVSSGTFGYQLVFYQRQGFRVSGLEKDFFINNYEEPVFEDGIQLRDSLRLVLNYPPPPGYRPPPVRARH